MERRGAAAAGRGRRRGLYATDGGALMSATRADSLTAAALAGLAYGPSAIPATGSPVDQLAPPGEDAGRDLLLRAGAAAVYRAAGRLARRDTAAPKVAPEETRPPCPLE